MSIGDVLGKIGSGLEKGAKVVGAIAEPLARNIANEEAGYAPQIAQEQRAHQQKLEDAAIAQKEQELTSQLEMGRKYGTLSPEQQSQYVDAISKLYSHPRHAGTLMEKLRKIVHPHGAIAGAMAPVALPNATPPGGIAAADEANAEKLATVRRAQQVKKGFDQYLEVYGREHGINPEEMTEAQLEDAHAAYYQATHAAMLDKEIVQDPNSETGFSVAEVDKRSGKAVSLFPGVLPRQGFVPKRRVSKTTDQYGNEINSVSEITPIIGKGTGGSANTTPAAQSAPAPPTAPSPTTSAPVVANPKRIGGILGGVKKPTLPSGPRAILPMGKGLKTLDPSGNIPAGEGNPQVREFANQLLNDRDVDKIPAKARAAASALAREYGWEQGKFTPKELTMLREASTFIDEAAGNRSLSVLDDIGSRAKLSQLIGDAQKRGPLGKLATVIVSSRETPQEAEFLRMYNQLVGTISGMAQLVRSGRATEQTIDRLANELPNPITTSSAADGKRRLARLQKEINVAQAKGSFTGGSPASALTGPGASLEDRLNKALE